MRTLTESFVRFAIFAGIVTLGTAQAQDADALSTPASKQALVSKYCAGCHNEKLRSGGFSWTNIDLAQPEKTPALTEKAIRMLRVGMMPPPGMPRPSASVAKAFAASLETRVDQASAAHPNPGSPDLHRLNRTEYRNAVKDLLNIDVDASSMLPADDMSHGFDNMADVLTVSPALMEGYIRAAGKISRLAVGDPQVAPTTGSFPVLKIQNQMRHVDGAPYGTRGGTSVVYYFPADGEYVFKVSFFHDLDGPWWGKNQGKGQQLEISVNGERVALLTLDPNMMPTDTRQTPAIAVKAGPQRVSAAFLEKFDGPVEDIVSPVENVLIDTTHSDIPGLTSLPHLRELDITGPTNITGISDTPSRRAIFTFTPSPAASGRTRFRAPRKLSRGWRVRRIGGP